MWADAQSDADNGYAAEQAGDYALAVKWLRWAAEQGDALGQTNLGVSDAHGKGVTEDYAEAVKCYRKAIEQGQFNRGWHYG